MNTTQKSGKNMEEKYEHHDLILKLNGCDQALHQIDMGEILSATRATNLYQANKEMMEKCTRLELCSDEELDENLQIPAKLKLQVLLFSCFLLCVFFSYFF